MPISKDYLNRVACDNGFSVSFNNGTVSVRDSDGIEFYSKSSGAKIAGALEAINARLQGTPDIETPGHRLPVSHTFYTSIKGDGATLWERNYDQEILDEAPVRDRVNACHLLNMEADGGLLDTAIREIVGSLFGGDTPGIQGWEFADTVDLQETIPVRKEIAVLLKRLYEEVIGSNNLYPAVYRMLWRGDAFASIGIVEDKTGFKISRLKWLPTFEVFRVEREYLENDKFLYEVYFEQRRYLSDDETIKMPYMSIVHWRHDYRGGLYGRALFYGDSCYNYWLGLKEAEEDLRKASRNVAIKPLIHRFADRYSPTDKAEYRRQIEEKRKKGAITDYFISGAESSVSSITGGNNDLTGLVDSIEYWRKAIATHARIPGYLLNIKVDGARDIAQQPALAYARYLDRLRQSFIEGIDHLVRLELMLHNIDPDKPENKWRVVFPHITINTFSDTQDQTATTLH